MWSKVVTLIGAGGRYRWGFASCIPWSGEHHVSKHKNLLFELS